MNLRRRYLVQNDCYKAGRTIRPKGVMVHSTGANNPNIKRYVQPDDGKLGTNANHNDWNRAGIQKCAHAFIGRLADDSIGTYQTLPWDHRGWHCGGDGNNTHISFEICEDGLTDAVYFGKVYREAVELTAYLCKRYNLDPLADGVVICHAEGYRRGIASGHTDVEHWFPRHGKTMDDFRRDVAAEMEDNMTQEQFDTMMNDYLSRLSQKPAQNWGSEWDEARNWAESEGIIKGDENGNKQYLAYTTRQAMVLFLFRFWAKVKAYIDTKLAGK